MAGQIKFPAPICFPSIKDLEDIRDPEDREAARLLAIKILGNHIEGEE
jgi:hypothetical protein